MAVSTATATVTVIHPEHLQSKPTFRFFNSSRSKSPKPKMGFRKDRGTDTKVFRIAELSERKLKRVLDEKLKDRNLDYEPHFYLDRLVIRTSRRLSQGEWDEISRSLSEEDESDKQNKASDKSTTPLQPSSPTRGTVGETIIEEQTIEVQAPAFPQAPLEPQQPDEKQPAPQTEEAPRRPEEAETTRTAPQPPSPNPNLTMSPASLTSPVTTPPTSQANSPNLDHPSTFPTFKRQPTNMARKWRAVARALQFMTGNRSQRVPTAQSHA